MNRRQFLKEVGRAGLVLGAAGAFPDTCRRADAAIAEKFRVIKLHGSPKNMGRQYAEQAGDMVRKRLERMREKGTPVNKDRLAQSRVFLMTKAHHIQVEMEALAGALGEQVEDLLILGSEPPGVGIQMMGCSSFVLDRKNAFNNKVWVGQNVDDDVGLERFGLLIIRHPGGSPPMMTWALAGSMGGVGFNWEGVALTMNYVHAKVKKAPIAIYPELVANAALRQKDFNSALKVISHTQLMRPVIFLLADRNGRRYVVERTPHMFRGFVPGVKFACATNHFRSKELEGSEQSKKVFPNTEGRLKRLKTLLDKMGLKDTDLKKVLADTQDRPHGICRQENPRTIASLLMCPATRKMFAAKGTPDIADYHEFLLPKDHDG